MDTEISPHDLLSENRRYAVHANGYHASPSAFSYSSYSPTNTHGTVSPSNQSMSRSRTVSDLHPHAHTPNPIYPGYISPQSFYSAPQRLFHDPQKSSVMHPEVSSRKLDFPDRAPVAPDTSVLARRSFPRSLSLQTFPDAVQTYLSSTSPIANHHSPSYSTSPSPSYQYAHHGVLNISDIEGTSPLRRSAMYEKKVPRTMHLDVADIEGATPSKGLPIRNTNPLSPSYKLLDGTVSPVRVKEVDEQAYFWSSRMPTNAGRDNGISPITGEPSPYSRTPKHYLREPVLQATAEERRKRNPFLVSGALQLDRRE
eukprot:GILI01023631.1.p1 GENE.GILI01023631.1~~GILI01023631.1.p1  ORF type:complete len:337 (-),score=12.32 GILI01023631.1:100-1035(-)